MKKAQEEKIDCNILESEIEQYQRSTTKILDNNEQLKNQIDDLKKLHDKFGTGR